MIDIAAIKARFETLAPFLDERERRLWAASEAYAAGHGGIVAVSAVTGIARSTIGRGLAELEHGQDQIPGRTRRPGGGRKSKIETKPGLLDALNELVQSAIRGDPEAALLWVINAQVQAFQDAGQPAISVDTKKKELVGDFKNAGRELRPKRHGRLRRREHPALVAGTRPSALPRGKAPADHRRLRR